MTPPTRREFLHTTAAVSLLGTSGLATKLQAAEDKKVNTAFDYQHAPIPLPFDTGGRMVSTAAAANAPAWV